MKINKVKKLKTVAHDRLSPCWGECAGIFFVTAGIVTVSLAAVVIAAELLFSAGVINRGINELFAERTAGFYICAGVYGAVMYALLSPLKYGIYWFCSQAIRGQNVPASCFFSCYMHRTHFFRTVKLSIITLLLRIAAALPLFAAGAAEYYFMEKIFRTDETAFEVVAAAALIPVTFAAAAHFVWIFARYMFVPFIYINDPDAGAPRIFSESKRLVKGNMLYILKTVLSFTVWFLVSAALIFPCIYSMPYFLMTLAALAKDISGAGKGRRRDNAGGSKEEGDALVIKADAE